MKKITILLAFLSVCSVGKIVAQNNSLVLFNEMKQIMQQNDLMVNYTTTTVRLTGESDFLYSYTANAISTFSLAYGNPNKIETGQMDVAFSDRNYFAGGKDRMKLSLVRQGNVVKVKIFDMTWTNQESELLNVTWRKEPYGYFLTAKGSDNRSTVYYTIALYKVFRIP
jgi:hypothetical protein